MKNLKNNEEKEAVEKPNLNDEYINIQENKRGIDRQISEAKFLGKQWLNIFKTQTVSTIIGGVLFIVALILVPIYLTKIFYSMSKDLGFLGFVVGFMSVILLGLVFSVTNRYIAIWLVKHDKHATKTTGRVVASSLLSAHIIGFGNNCRSRKVLRTTYKVKIKVENKTTIAYSRNFFYEPDEEVEILFNSKRPFYSVILSNENKK